MPSLITSGRFWGGAKRLSCSGMSVCVCEDLEVQGSGFDWWVLCYGGGFGEVAFDEGLKGQWWGWCFLIFVLRFMRMFEDLGLLIDLV